MEPLGFVRVKNLEKYQHYKKRNPPWIKLHALIFESYEFCRLPDAARWHALAIAILASKLDNVVPADPEWIQSRTQSKSTPDIELLLRSGFIERVVASKALARRKHDASTLHQNSKFMNEIGDSETETETETETEAERIDSLRSSIRRPQVHEPDRG